MDRKSKILIAITFLAIIVSFCFLYNRYITRKDFVVFRNENGIPLNEEQ